MAFLEISSVSKRFGPATILEDVSLEIEAGEFVVFVGPSGCGKSTLLRMITGLEDITAGTISIGGEVMNDVEPSHRGTAMVFQSYALYPHMTSFENMSFGLRMAREAKQIIRDKVAKAAAILQLEQLLDRPPSRLSGGQKQRVAIGRAIVREPNVFLFDEPLSNLDAELRVQMRAELIDLHNRLEATMIYVTHDQIEAMTLADKMVVMNAGRVQQAGHPLDLYDDPDNMFVAGFVGSPKMNFLSANVVGCDAGTVRLMVDGQDQELTLPFAGFDPAVRRVTLGIRPEHVRMAGDEPADGAFVIGGDVDLVEELGDVCYVRLRCPDGACVTLRNNVGRYGGGTTARFGLDIAQIRVFDQNGQRLRPSGSNTA